MCYSPYHRGYNPLIRNHKSWFGAYEVTFMSEGPWSYIMDDFGNAVPVPTNSHMAQLLFTAVGL